VEPLARIELSSDAPAEVIRLMPQVGLEPVLPAGAASPLASTRVRERRTHAPIAIRVEYDAHRIAESDAPAASAAPALCAVSGTRATLAIALDSVPSQENSTADSVTGSARAAVCLILSRVLGLRDPFLTADGDLFDLIRAAVAVGRGPARILVEGEIGVGKESLIKLIHAASADPAALMHAECAGLEASSVEAEFAPLLAYAASSNSARVQAGGGAIFFNRIGELSPPAQHRLVDLLSTFGITASDRAEAIDLRIAPDSPPPPAKVRLLAAFTRPFAATAALGELIPELHRLFDATLAIPPLRARHVDLPLLAQHYLHRFNPALRLNAAALAELSRHRFPGNVLELINVVTRVAVGRPLSAKRRSAADPPAPGIVGRTEMTSHLLDSLGLIAVEPSTRRSHSRRSRKPRALPAAPVEAGGSDAAIERPILVVPASLRLTTGTVTPLRKPRGKTCRPL
jgi:transcriptional regulator of acetoin/glycerol metabolism